MGKSNYNTRKLVRLYINLIIYYSRLNFDTYLNKRPQYEIDFIKLRRKNFEINDIRGGSCQVNAINKAKEFGHEVIVADYLDNPPGREIADYSC